MTVKALTTVAGPLADDLYRLFVEAMDELVTEAVQRHTMTRVEYDTAMADERITKYVHLDEAGTPDGLAACTDDLAAVPLIEPRWFAHHHPAEYASGRIWYVLFLAVAPHAQRGGVFRALATEIRKAPAEHGGLVFLDVCARRRREGFPRLIAAVADSPAEEPDAQTTIRYRIRRGGR